MITSLTLPFPLDLPMGRALDLREVSAMMEAGVPGGRCESNTSLEGL